PYWDAIHSVNYQTARKRRFSFLKQCGDYSTFKFQPLLLRHPHAVSASVSKTCLVRFDNNKYSVKASSVGRPVEIQAYADRIVIRQDGIIVGEHRRRFGREEVASDPWHYVPVLTLKPGALRNGSPVKDCVLPGAAG